MTATRQQAADALRPFADAWAALREGPEHFRRPGYALLSIGDTAVTATHLRLAAEAHAALTAKPKQD